MTSFHLSTTLIPKVYGRILLNQCYVCGFKHEGTLCTSCRTFLTVSQHRCKRCARQTATPIALCGECQKAEPYFAQAIAPLLYQGLCRALITKAKFENQPHLLRPLIDSLATHILQHHSPIPRIWSCVPTTQSSLIERGFCQTHLIQHLLIRTLRQRLPDLHITRLPIERRYDVQAQHTLSKKARQALTHKQFLVSPITAEPVLLIDDIITTGSTANACAQALRLAGASEVIVWALARTPEN